MPVYVGERYVADAEPRAALDQARRVRTAAQRLAKEGAPLRLLSTTFVPNEEWVFDLFEAPSVQEVRHVYEASGVAVERITEGVHLPGP